MEKEKYVDVSPIQANVLKLLVDLSENEPYFKLYGHKSVYLDCNKYSMKFNEIKNKFNRKITFATINSLEKKKYVELAENNILKSDGSLRFTETIYRINKAGSELVNFLSPEAFVFIPSKKAVMTEKQITDAIRTFYEENTGISGDGGWVFIPQLRNGTGWLRQQRYIDGYLLNLWPSRNIHAIAFEIKVSRTDFLKELSEPEKRQPAMDISNEFYFIAPKGLIDRKELPEECGLMEAYFIDEEQGIISIRTTKKAKRRNIATPSWHLVNSIVRRMRQIREVNNG